MGRPKKEVSEKQVFELAQIGCTYDEMAAILDIDKANLIRRFAPLVKKGKENMRMSLRRMQLDSAKKGNVTMQIWLGKQLLGQSEYGAGDENNELANFDVNE